MVSIERIYLIKWTAPDCLEITSPFDTGLLITIHGPEAKLIFDTAMMLPAKLSNVFLYGVILAR